MGWLITKRKLLDRMALPEILSQLYCNLSLDLHLKPDFQGTVHKALHNLVTIYHPSLTPNSYGHMQTLPKAPNPSTSVQELCPLSAMFTFWPGELLVLTSKIHIQIHSEVLIHLLDRVSVIPSSTFLFIMQYDTALESSVSPQCWTVLPDVRASQTKVTARDKEWMRLLQGQLFTYSGKLNF